MMHHMFAAALLALVAAPAAAQPAPEPVPPILLDQIGFRPDAPKLAIVPSDAAEPLDWQLLDAKGKVVLSGRTLVFGADAASGEKVHQIVFSAFGKPGTGYRLRVGDRLSRAFAIGPDVGKGLARDALAFFYNQRAGVPIEARFVGETWARPAGHTNEVAVCVEGKDFRGTEWPGCPIRFDVTGGWYDAGDQGKYVVNGGIALWTLLNAWERAHLNGSDKAFADGSARIPEAGNGVPDLLDEARYEMEFLLRMQLPDEIALRLPVGTPPPFVPPAPGTPPGPPPPLALPMMTVEAGGMAMHKVGDRNWTKLPTPPAEDREERILFPPSTAATLNLAATAAQCARIWRTIDPAFAARCLAAAERAWSAAKRNPELFALAAFTGSGGYGDRDVSDEFFWAAVELWATTHEPEYLDFVRSSPWWTAPAEEPSWGKVSTLGYLSLAVANQGMDEPDREHVVQTILASADRFAADADKTGYHVPYDPPGYPWGSTSSLLNRAILLAYAADYTHAAKYRDAVADALDYLLGRNPIDKSFVSGWGARPLTNPHHRFWAHSLDPKLPGPPPGVLSGGPNSTVMGDPVASKLRGHCAPMTCYADEIEAFTVNEVAINWNAPLFWVAAWMEEQAAEK